MVLQFIRRIEKQLVVPSTKKRRVVERKSLWLIKIVMKIIPVGVFIESVVYADWQWQSLLIGSVCVGVGLLLRINAIRALGEYWTFHPTMYYQPYRVETGVYRYFYHPAYLGNIWLVGLCVLVSCYVTSLVVAGVLCIFYLYRTQLEARIMRRVVMEQ